MADWDAITAEMRAAGSPDAIRRRYAAAVREQRGRPLLLYVTDWIYLDRPPANSRMVNYADADALTEVLAGTSGDKLDVLIQSPGGLAEAAESIVHFLRRRFSDIAFIVPTVSKSAATMLALSGNVLLMDDDAELGPIDPQVQFAVPGGASIAVGAQEVIAQFNRVQTELKKNPQAMAAWLPTLNQYTPGLLERCQEASRLSETLVGEWMECYMFAGAHRGKARAVARALNNHTRWHSHSRMIPPDKLASLGVNVCLLSAEPTLRSLIRDAMVAVNASFLSTTAFKIVECGDTARIWQAQPPGMQALRPQFPRPMPPNLPQLPTR